MDLLVTDEVDIAGLRPGMTVHLQIRRSGEDHYEIAGIHVPGAAAGQEAPAHGQH